MYGIAYVSRALLRFLQ